MNKRKTTDYQDILSTEDCVLDALESLKEYDDTNNKEIGRAHV